MEHLNNDSVYGAISGIEGSGNKLVGINAPCSRG
jgi:hypothetical protein